VISLFGLAGILYAIVVVQERQRFFQGFLRLQYATTSGDNHTRFRDDCFSPPGNLGKQGKRAKNESQKI
jgi:hypothetical protein